MAVKLEGRKRPYHPKDTDVVECQEHGVKTTWGALDEFQRMALEAGVDTADHLPCLLAPKYAADTKGQEDAR